jgi:thermitase
MVRSLFLILFFAVIIALLIYFRSDSDADTSVQMESANTQTFRTVKAERATAITSRPFAAPVQTDTQKTEEASALSDTPHVLPKDDNSRHLPGELIIRRNASVPLKSLEEFFEKNGIRIERQVDELSLIRVTLPDDISIEDAKKLLREYEGIEKTYTNIRTRVPRDVVTLPPVFEGRQIAPVEQMGLELIHSTDPVARNSYGNGVTIAILDTGVDSTHPDLVDRTLRGYNFIDDNLITDDAHSHGTACAGIIAGKGTGTGSMKGIAPGAWIMPVKVMDAEGKGSSFTVVEGIVYAVENGADVINISLGTMGDAEIVRDAVLYAKQKDVLVIAAIGNDGEENALLPAGYQDVVCVGAVDAHDNRAPFSNYNVVLDIVAPGVAVYTTAPDKKHMQFTGTSAAAPFVTGVAAALRSLYPHDSAEEIRERILNGADDLGYPGRDPYYGEGLVNLKRAAYSNTDTINDLAVTALFFTPAQPVRGEEIVTHCVVQNQGTKTVRDGTLIVNIQGEKEEISLPTLAPGNTHYITRKQLLPATAQEVREFRVEVYCYSGATDSEPEDNGRALVLFLSSL